MIKLKPADRERQLKFYTDNLEIYGYDPRSLGWTPDHRDVRFRIMEEIGDLDGCSLLDVGCGFGDFYGYLLNRGYSVRYTGIDINPRLVEIGRAKYPDAHFIVGDFEDIRFFGRFDWVFASGIFNLRINNNKTFIESSLKRMHHLCSRGFYADFLRSAFNYYDSLVYHQDPVDMLDFCLNLSARVTLRCDYMPSEFCIYVYRRDKSNRRQVYKEFDEKMRSNK